VIDDLWIQIWVSKLSNCIYNPVMRAPSHQMPHLFKAAHIFLKLSLVIK